MSAPWGPKTLANGLAVDLFFCDVLAGLHPHPEHKLYLKRVAEIRAP
jgi:hypothetical protein